MSDLCEAMILDPVAAIRARSEEDAGRIGEIVKRFGIDDTNHYFTVDLWPWLLEIFADRATLLHLLDQFAGEQVEWLCERENVIHPSQGNRILQPCPDCGDAMAPTSQNLREITRLRHLLDRAGDETLAYELFTRARIRAEQAEAEVARLKKELP